MRPSRPALPFSLPFALIGVVYAADLAFVIESAPPHARVALVVCTPFMCALVGLLVSRGDDWVRRVIQYALLGGVLNGLLVGPTCDVARGTGLGIGAFAGLFCSVFFLPSLLLVAKRAHDLVYPRRGSLLEAARRRTLIRATLTTCAVLGMPLAIAYLRATRELAACLELGLLVGVALTTVFDGLAVVRLAEVRRLARSLQPIGDEAPIVATDRQGVDLGNGTCRFVQLVEPLSLRAAPVLRLALVGDIEEAVRTSRWSLATAVAQLAFVAGLFAAAFVAP